MVSMSSERVSYQGQHDDDSKTNHVIADATYITTVVGGSSADHGKGYPTLSIRGTLDDITMHCRVTFTPALHFHGDSSITIKADDLGNSGQPAVMNGGSKSAGDNLLGNHKRDSNSCSRTRPQRPSSVAHSLEYHNSCGRCCCRDTGLGHL